MDSASAAYNSMASAQGVEAICTENSVKISILDSVCHKFAPKQFVCSLRNGLATADAKKTCDSRGREICCYSWVIKKMYILWLQI